MNLSPKGLLRSLSFENGRASRRWAAVLIMGIVVAAYFLVREPRYHGRPASHWLDLINCDFVEYNYSGKERKEDAVTAFRAMGNPGLRYLLKQSRDKRERGPSLASMLEEQIDKHDLSQKLPTRFIDFLDEASRPKNRRSNAFTVIQALGADAEPILPDLMRDYQKHAATASAYNWDLYCALDGMGDTKAAYTSVFAKYLDSNSAEVACEAANLLGSIGPKAHEAVPQLLNTMPSGDEILSNSVAEALWRIDKQTNVALGVFTNQLMTFKHERREIPLRNLCMMGTAAKPAAPFVLGTLSDRNDRIRRVAAKCLRQIDPALYRSAMDELNQRIPERIVDFVEQMKSSSNQPPWVYRALNAFAVYGTNASPAVPQLIELIESTPVDRKKILLGELLIDRAARTLGHIGGRAAPATPAIVRLLDTELGPNVRFLVCRTLGNFGPAATDAIPALSRALTDESPAVRVAAAAAILKINPDRSSNEVAITVLKSFRDYCGSPWMISPKSARENGDPRYSSNRELTEYVQLPARVCLWKLGLEKNPPIEELILKLGHRSANEEIFTVLGDIGPAAEEAVPILVQMLDSPEEVSDIEAAIALQKINPKFAADLQLPGIVGLP